MEQYIFFRKSSYVLKKVYLLLNYLEVISKSVKTMNKLFPERSAKAKFYGKVFGSIKLSATEKTLAPSLLL